MTRNLIWWSTGAASAVVAQLMLREDPEAILVRCDTNNEDPDNYRYPPRRPPRTTPPRTRFGPRRPRRKWRHDRHGSQRVAGAQGGSVELIMPWVAPIIGYSDNVGVLRCSECAEDRHRVHAVHGDGWFGNDDVCESCKRRFEHVPTSRYVQVAW